MRNSRLFLLAAMSAAASLPCGALAAKARIRPHYPYHDYAPLRDHFATRNPEYARAVSEVLAYYEALENDPKTPDPGIHDKMSYIEEVIVPAFRKTRPRDGCPDCRADGTVAFDPGAGFERGYLKTLSLEKKLKFGELHVCSRCGMRWVFDGVRFLVVPRTQDGMLREWDRKRLSFSPEIRRALEKIGADPAFPGAQGRTYPCRVRIAGRWHDFATISFQAEPPLVLSAGGPRIVFADEVEAVAPSDYALSHEVRRYLQDGADRALSEFHPSPVRTRSGRRFLVPARASFLDVDGIEGKELLVPDDRSRSGEVLWAARARILVIADPMEGSSR